MLLFETLAGEDPFESKTCKHLEKKHLEREVIHRITSHDFKIAYPEFMSDSAKLLLQGLFMRDPTKRVTQGVAVAQYKFEEVHSSKPWTGTD